MLKYKFFLILFFSLTLAILLNAKFVYFKITYPSNHFSNLSLETDRKNGVKYLNKLREAAGLNHLQENSLLDESAQNHANYLITNNLFTHYENSSYPNFTGQNSKERTLNVGYYGLKILENISAGDKDIFQSINNLFSAIYHRFAFLDYEIDEIGIGEASSSNYSYKTVFVYNMGTTNNLNEIGGNNPDYILWPYNNATNVKTVFFEEMPDPLPECSVSGYPISIEFNKTKTNHIKMLHFSLYEKDTGKKVECKILSSENDPNNLFNSLQFALMPLERLKFNTSYIVKFIYSVNNEPETITWNFTTESFNSPYYIIEDIDVNLDIKPNQYYYLYFKPKNCNDKFNSFNYVYHKKVPEIELKDYNIIKVKANSNLEITTSNNRHVILNVTNKDNAIYPELNNNSEKNNKIFNASPETPQTAKLYVKENPPVTQPKISVNLPPSRQVIIQPELNIPKEIQGASGTLIMYLKISNLWIPLFSKSVNKLNEKIKFKFAKIFNLSNVDNLVFEIWYGVIVDKKLYYNAYKIIIRQY